MRYFLMISISCLLLTSGAAKAQNSDEKAWIEMMEVCVKVITDQSDAIMEGFPATTGLVNVVSLPKRAIRHPDAPVIASAVSVGDKWFMCLVAGDPAVRAPQSAGLIGTIIGTLAGQINQSGDHAIVLEDIFAPVRITCRDKGQLTATLAFLTDDGEFRIAAVDNLPSSVANPCLKAGMETGQRGR